MKKSSDLTERYCTFIEKNVLIEKNDADKHYCLYSRECKCGDKCRNSLLNVKIILRDDK